MLRLLAFSDSLFTGDPESGTAGDLSPEGLTLVAKSKSPIDKPLLIVGYEVSGSVAIFEINKIDSNDDDSDDD